VCLAQTTTDPATEAPAEVPDISNSTNLLNYNFRDYRKMEEVRTNWNAFLTGANATWYAPNSTNCFNNILNLMYYDVDLFIVKMMYGNFKDNMLNTTLFMRNFSDVSYLCLDTGENLYVYSMYKFKLFSFSWTNVLLGVLQNSLGRILTINKIYTNRIKVAESLNDTLTVYYNLGRIATLLLDFEPLMMDASGMDGDVFLQPLPSNT
jgi:hypothetical protein